MGGGESQTLIVATSSANTALIPDPQVIYTSPNATATLRYTPVPNAHGASEVTVIALDSGGEQTSRTFTVVVNPVADTPSVTHSTTFEDTQTTTGRNVIGFWPGGRIDTSRRPPRAARRPRGG